jgi:hypothetical protein
MSLQIFKPPVIFDNNVTSTKGFNIFGNVTAANIFVSSITGTFYGDGSNLVGASLPGQSAINTTVQTNSSNWNVAYNIGTAYQSASSFFSTNSLQTTLNYLSTNNIILSSAKILNDLIVVGTISATNTEIFNISSYNITTTTSVSNLEVSGNLIVTGNISAASLSAYHIHKPSEIYLANVSAFSQTGCLVGKHLPSAGLASEVPVGAGLRFELLGTPIPLGVDFADDGSTISEKVVNASDKRLTVYSHFQNISSKLVRSDSTLETPTTGLSTIQNIVSLSQSTYNALTIKSPTTLYIIV